MKRAFDDIVADYKITKKLKEETNEHFKELEEGLSEWNTHKKMIHIKKKLSELSQYEEYKPFIKLIKKFGTNSIYIDDECIESSWNTILVKHNNRPIFKLERHKKRVTYVFKQNKESKILATKYNKSINRC